MLKVGQVLYRRYEGLVLQEGGNPFQIDKLNDRVIVEYISEEDDYIRIDSDAFTIKPDYKGLSWKTFFSEV